MKKYLLFAACLFVLTFYRSIPAQDIPNCSFETWSSIGNGMENPDNWDSSNEILLGTFIFNTTTKETASPFDGTISVKIKSISQTIPLVGEIVIPGLITVGEFYVDIEAQTGGVSGGIPFPFRPTKLRGYFKYQPTGTDSCFIGIGLAKAQADTIGTGYMKAISTPSWTLFEIPIEYTSEDTPDSMNIVIMSSNPEADFQANSTIWVDSLSFDFSVSVEEQYTENSIFIYPNPAKDYLYIMTPFKQKVNIKIYNPIGCLVADYNKMTISGKSSKLNISNLTAGIYLIEIVTGKEKIVKKIFVK
ncbi:MAG: PCMD domain-containing protein [Bacteroidia bacterium]|nr:PCMD domain-containing protein [Bacteroidia bacterium]